MFDRNDPLRTFLDIAVDKLLNIYNMEEYRRGLESTSLRNPDMSALGKEDYAFMTPKQRRYYDRIRTQKYFQETKKQLEDLTEKLKLNDDETKLDL